MKSKLIELINKIELVNEYVSNKEHIVEISKKIENLNKNIYIVTDLERELKYLYEEQKRYKSIFKRIFTKNRNELSNINYQISINENELSKYDDLGDLKQELKLLYGELSRLQDKTDNIKTFYEINSNLLNYFEVMEDGTIKINSTQELNVNVKSDLSQLSNSEKILIHSTSVFPEDKMIKTGYEGKKIDKDGMIKCTYNGVDKITKHYSERRTVHFTINSPVESHGYGNFDETDFVVLEPYSYHESEYISVAVPDTWTRNSVRLTNEAILLVSEEQYQKLAEEQKKLYNIVVFSNIDKNSRVIATKNLIRFLGYQVLEKGGCGNHYNSSDARLEESFKTKTRGLNFMFDNKITPYDNVELTSDELITLYEIFRCNKKFSLQPKQKASINTSILCTTNDIEGSLLEFFILLGCEKKEDKYVFKDYYNILKFIEDYEQDKVDINSLALFIEKNGLVQLSERIEEKNNIKNNYKYSINDILNLRYEEINKFENLEKEKVLSEYLKELMGTINGLYKDFISISFCENGIEFKFYEDKNESIEKYYNEEFYFMKRNPDIDKHFDYNEVQFIMNCEGLPVLEIINKVKEYIEYVRIKSNAISIVK